MKAVPVKSMNEQYGQNKDLSIGFSYKKLFSDIAVYGSGNLLIKGMSLISAPIFTRLFEPGEYGVWSFINVFVAFLTGILILGGDNAYTRYFFQCKSEEEKQTLTATWFSFLALWSIVVMAAVLPFSNTLAGWMLGDENYLAAWIIGIISSPLAMMNLTLAQALRIRFRAKLFALFNILTAVLTIIFSVILVLIFNLGVAGALLGAALASLVIIPLRLWSVRELLRFGFSLQFLKKLLLFGLPLVPMNIAFWLFSNADRIMLARLASMAEVGLYAIAAALAAVLMLLQNATGQSWQPHAIKIYEENKDLAATVFRRTMVFLLAASGVVITAFVALAQETIFILVPPEYYDSFWAIPMLASGFLFFTSAHVTVVAIMVKNKTLYIMYACWLIAVINIGLNYLLIPPFGIVGAGAATGISYILFALSYALISRRLWPVNYPLKSIAALLAVPFLAIAIITLIAFAGPTVWLNLILKIVVTALCAVILLHIVSRTEGKRVSELFMMGKKILVK